MAPKVMVIGLDSATFRFIRPFAEKGYLPNIQRCMKQGVTRVLKSTIPPISPPAWTTFLTGMNPGQHGIFHFLDIDAKNYNFTSNRLINSSLVTGRTFLDFISDHNLRVGAVKIPFTYPAWQVNGFMIAGEPSPDWKKAHTYPPELSERIGQVNLGSESDFVKYNPEQLFEHLKYDCQVRTRISCEMLDSESLDFFMLVQTATDAASHRFWKYMDKSCPNYSHSSEQYFNLIRDVYVQTDKSIGQILAKMDSNTTLFIMSDHGAARKPLRFFHINAWLKQKGYLATAEERSSAHYLHNILIDIKNRLPYVFRQKIINVIKHRFQETFSTFQVRASNIDWAQTKAYAVNLYNCCDGIVLNLKNRQQKGIVPSEQDAQLLKEKLCAELKKITDPDSGKPIIEYITRRDELFSGPYTEKIPDLIIGYTPDYRSGKNTDGPLFGNVPATDFDFQSGDHDQDGIFIAVGPNVKKDIALNNAHIRDMAPTILFCMGLSIPEQMEGKVLFDIFDTPAGDRKDAPKTSEHLRKTNLLKQLSKKEEEEMRAQLQSLGYL